MFEKIARYAEKVATSAGQSRRGFLGRLGNGALGVAGVVGGLLLFPGQALAQSGCQYSCPDGTTVRFNCPCGNKTCIKHKAMTCCLAARDCPHTRAIESQEGTIRIEVWDGVVQNVSNLPPGWDYEIVDFDHLMTWRAESLLPSTR
jgi:hypothetical protein